MIVYYDSGMIINTKYIVSIVPATEPVEAGRAVVHMVNGATIKLNKSRSRRLIYLMMYSREDISLSGELTERNEEDEDQNGH